MGAPLAWPRRVLLLATCRALFVTAIEDCFVWAWGQTKPKCIWRKCAKCIWRIVQGLQVKCAFRSVRDDYKEMRLQAQRSTDYVHVLGNMHNRLDAQSTKSTCSTSLRTTMIPQVFTHV